MKNLGFLLKFVVVLSILLSAVAVAQAQATRTWVAHAPTGDDANPCSRSAPCATFAGAISKTREGGEIDAIDPGSFGSVSITKALTIDGGTGAGWAGILATEGANGITVNVTTGTNVDNAAVVLRHLTLNGAKEGPGTGGAVGIQVIKVSELHIDNVNIGGFVSQGINIDGADAVNVFINHVSLNHDTTAVRVNTAAGFVATAYLDDVSIQGNTNGLNAVANAFAVIRNSYFAENRGGTNGAVKVSSGCTVSLENNMFAGNNIAVNVASGGTANISNNSFYGNVAALSGTGTIATATNSNKFAANGSDGATNVTITLK
ncbi:MAG TPA: hypothetical protein VGO56_19180 [Pyrinomonadaceae bacterium]|jgi:hypothetical protein|nr:hypothetical protein [Pyrinomonadaceae bacterium]